MTGREKTWQVAFIVVLGLGAIATNAITDAITGATPHMDPWKGKLFLGIIGGVIGIVGNIANTLGIATKVPGAVASLLLVPMLLFGAPRPAQAGSPPLAFDRVAAGVQAQGALYEPAEGKQSTGFLPGAWASYTVTSQLSLAGSAERDFSADLAVLRGGARVLLASPASLVQVFAGVDALHYDGDAVPPHPDSWSASLRAGWVAARSQGGRDLLYFVGSAEYDPDNHLSTYRLGLRVPVIGGR